MPTFESLPGFRDFYPEDCQTRNFIFSVLRKVCRQHNFVEYAVPSLQPTELFIEKSGSEIVSQLFNFKDKAERCARYAKKHNKSTRKLDRLQQECFG